MQSVLAHALAYVDSGLSVVPVPYRQKRPILKWKEYQSRRPTKPELLLWFGSGRNNIAIVCGKISNNLIVLDFDYNAQEIYPAWQKKARIDLPTISTSKGYHVYFRSELPIRNTKLAFTGEENFRDRRVLIETRADGGFVVTAPSIHSCGKLYETIKGSLLSIPTISNDAAGKLIDLAKEFDQRPNSSYYEVDVEGEEYSGVVTVDSIREFAKNLLNKQMDYIVSSPNGSRNHRLFRAAATLGSFMSIYSLDAVVNNLLSACATNGLIRDDGHRSAIKTIESGLNAGAKSPIEVQLDPIVEELFGG